MMVDWSYYSINQFPGVFILLYSKNTSWNYFHQAMTCSIQKKDHFFAISKRRHPDMILLVQNTNSFLVIIKLWWSSIEGYYIQNNKNSKY